MIIFIIFPLITGIQKDSQELISLKSEMSLLEQTKGNVEDLKRVSVLHQQNVEAIDAVFVDPAVPIDFIRFIETIAADSQISFEISLGQEKNIYENSISFQVSLNGSFPHFLKFLEKLENGPYPIEISSLNIKKTTEGKISAALTFFVLAKSNGR